MTTTLREAIARALYEKGAGVSWLEWCPWEGSCKAGMEDERNAHSTLNYERADAVLAVLEGFLVERDREKFNEGYLAGREFGFKRAQDAAVQRVEALPTERPDGDQRDIADYSEDVVAAIKEGQA